MKTVLIAFLLAAVLMLTGCSLFESTFELDKAINYINSTDLPPETKQVLVDALRAAFTGGASAGDILGHVADGVVAAALGYFGIKNAPKIFAKKSAAAPSVDKPAG